MLPSRIIPIFTVTFLCKKRRKKRLFMQPRKGRKRDRPNDIIVYVRKFYDPFIFVLLYFTIPNFSMYKCRYTRTRTVDNAKVDIINTILYHIFCQNDISICSFYSSRISNPSDISSSKRIVVSEVSMPPPPPPPPPPLMLLNRSNVFCSIHRVHDNCTMEK